MNSLAPLLRPASVAVVGASADLAKTAGRPLAYLIKHGYSGAIFPVNPRVAEIAGLHCYSKVADLPVAPDVGIVMLGPERAEDAVRELSARGTRAAIVLASGYGETGSAGRVRQERLRLAAGRMRLLGPNTIGLVNVTDRITLSASGALEIGNLPAGPIALVSQSGGILGAVLSRAVARGLGFSKLVSTGNEVDLDVADFIEDCVADPATRVIAVYLEGLRNPARFRAAAQAALAAGKPVVAFKVGRSQAGRAAAASHTGAMAGEDRVYDAYFADCGVVRAPTFEDFVDLPGALASPRRPQGARVAVLTSTGGAGTLVADSLALAGLDVAAPGPETALHLRSLQDDLQMVLDRNPIDITLAGLQPDLLRAILAGVLDSGDYDALVVIVGSSALAQPTLMADAIAATLEGRTRPVLAYVSPHAPAVLAALNRSGVPAFTTPEAIATALTAMRTAESLRAAAIQPEAPATAPTLPTGSNALDRVAPHGGSLDEAAARRLFGLFGIAAPREQVVADAAGATHAAQALGGAVVLKLLSTQITHKSDVGGVATGLDAATVGPALEAMRARLVAAGHAAERFLVQESVAGVEMLLGAHRDAQLGPVLMLGFGGVNAELIDDQVLRMLPPAGVSADTARGMIAGLRMRPLLEGWRGRPQADVAALSEAIVAFSRMAADLGERLVEAEINPLFVRPAGQGVCAADGVAVLRPAQPVHTDRQHQAHLV